MRLHHIIGCLCVAVFLSFNPSDSQAQTQAEIEQMMNGGTTETKEKTKEKKEKTEKAAKDSKEDAEEKVKEAKDKSKEKAEEKKEKAKDEVDSAKEKGDKKAKATEAKVEDAKEAMPKDEPKAEKVKVEKTTAPKSSGSSSGRSTAYNKPFRTWTLGVAGNLTNPYTDIRYKDFFGTIDPRNENQWGAQLRLTKMFDGAFGVMFQAQYNRIQGTFDSLVIHDEDRDYLVGAGIDQGVFFRNNVIQGSLNLYWNISNTIFNANRYYKAQQDGRKMKPRKFSLYAYSGIGISVFDPHVMFNANKAPASFPGIKFYDDQSAEVVLPMAIGAKFNLGKAMDLGFEYSWQYVFSDKLDGFIFDHPGRIKNDMYSNLSMVFDFKMGGKKTSKDHIEWSNPIEPIYEDLANLNKKVKRLTTDVDEDGVSDFFDKDTETEEGATVDGSGQAMDIDRDGIPDYADLEPFSDIDADTDEFGLSLDDDGDGVPNHLDKSPNTPDGQLVNFQGDEIVIPEGGGSGSGDGFGFPSIYFDTDMSNIKREWEDELFLIARSMKRNPGMRVMVTGHCDERGGSDYNMELGQRRADKVKQYLMDNYKIESARIATESKGKTELKTSKYHINRRVDVEIVE